VNELLPSLIRVAGLLQLVMAALNFTLPGQLDYRRNLPRLSTIVRQVFVIHSIYIPLTLSIFGLLCILHAEELATGAGSARFLNVSLTIFWGLRLGIQLFYYDREFLRTNLLARLGLPPVLIFLTAVFATATARGGP
jgi:hypothetical protein